VPDLRTLGSPPPAFIVAPLPESSCLLIRTPQGDWLVNTGRETPVPSSIWHLLQYYGINRLEGLVLAQISTPDNGGAEMIARDFRPRQVVVPCLSSRSPLEKAVPTVVALSGGRLDEWRRGQKIDLGQNVSVEVLHPAPDSAETRAEDRSLVLLFHAGDCTLLWAGKISPEAQADILAAYPELHVDVLVMGAETQPDDAWLRTLSVRYWLQIPPRDRQLNTNQETILQSDTCEVWPLAQTGAVEIHFQSAQKGLPPGISLQPWLALPGKP